MGQAWRSGIMNLVIIFKLAVLFSVLFVEKVKMLPYKIPVHLDISGVRPTKITIAASEEFPGGVHCVIRTNARHINVIGTVSDGGEVIIDGDPRVMSRYVLTCLKKSGAKYVRVISRYRTSGNIFTHIKEFIRRPGYRHYTQVTRTPIGLNILAQGNDDYFNVYDSFSTYSSTGSCREYTIRRDKMDDVIIGEVRYGKYIVNNKVEDLISRKVTWEGGPQYPLITVSSRYNDGTDIIVSYVYIGGTENMFYIWEDKKKTISFIE